MCSEAIFGSSLIATAVGVGIMLSLNIESAAAITRKRSSGVAPFFSSFLLELQSLDSRGSPLHSPALPTSKRTQCLSCTEHSKRKAVPRSW